MRGGLQVTNEGRKGLHSPPKAVRTVQESFLLCPDGHQGFEQRLEEADEKALKKLRRGWCRGSQEFRSKMLELMDAKLGDNHSGDLRGETAEQKAERIITEELTRLSWTESDLPSRMKSDPGKLAITARLRNETTLMRR